MATLLQIAQLGRPLLRQKAKPVANIKDTQIQKLIDDLLETVMDVNCVGIAAPQVYVSQRIFIVASHPNPRYPHAPDMVPTSMINPRLISHSKATQKDWEGCLSIPGIRGLVPRWTEIQVAYTTSTGKKTRAEFTDFIARIFQHEYDHLEGIMFLDRVETTQDFISEKEYQKLTSQKK